MSNGWPIFHDDAVSAMRAVLVAWGPLVGEERWLAEAMAAAVKVEWEEIAPPARATATRPASEGEGVDGRNK